MAIVVCQTHLTLFEHEHATPSQSHADSAAHSLLDFSCTGMAAVLPTVVMFALVMFHMLHTLFLVLHPAAPVFPPFVPPRHTTR